jgi:ABC-type amino acid transport substrate-binding protein
VRFDKVKTLEDLRKISLGLGKGWEGYIYKTNGFNLTEPVTFDLLLKMLAGGRYDFVPLSTVEIQDSYEVDHQPLNNLVPEQHLLICTQLPNYFYVSPQAPKLAERLRQGLKLMQSNGSLNELFDKHFAQRLKRLNLKNRRVIVIPNPQDDGSLGQFDIKNLGPY